MGESKDITISNVQLVNPLGDPQNLLGSSQKNITNGIFFVLLVHMVTDKYSRTMGIKIVRKTFMALPTNSIPC
jgi:hypothetical protein